MIPFQFKEIPGIGLYTPFSCILYDTLALVYSNQTTYNEKKSKHIHRWCNQVSKNAEIRNQYNQAPHLTQDTTWETDKNTRELHIQASKEASPSQLVTVRLQWKHKI